MTVEEILSQDFGTLADVIRVQAADKGPKPALIDAKRVISYAELDVLMDRIAAALQRDGVGGLRHQLGGIRRDLLRHPAGRRHRRPPGAVVDA